MWMLTPFRFFSVVQKSGDEAQGTLTVRARVRKDLDDLRKRYLPSLGEVFESKTNDYRYRAQAPREAVSAAMADIVNELAYSNFKSQVGKEQGAARANLYHDVWDVLYRLQTDKKFSGAGPSLHPQRDDKGKLVEIKNPSQASDLSAWANPHAVACAVPDGLMPDHVNGMPITGWVDLPPDVDAWEALAAENTIEEPPFKAPVGLQKSAGVVIKEPDGRFWVVAPSNGFGGYLATFPKGRLDGKSAQACALTEAFEESGLRVRLIRHLIDVKRTTTYTRYYLAERIGGDPADMGWEAQSVMLVPRAELPLVLNSPNDKPIIEALQNV